MKHQSFVNTELNDWTVLFQTIQFCISRTFCLLTEEFDQLIGTYHVLRARVNLVAMAMKGYSTFPKASKLLKPYHQIF